MNDMQQGVGIGQGPTPQMTKAIIDAPIIQCECGSHTFSMAYVLKKVPGLYFGETEPLVYPINVYVCSECGKIMADQLSDKNFENLVGKEAIEKMSNGRTISANTDKETPTIKPLIIN